MTFAEKINQILVEWCAKDDVKDGLPDLTNKKHLTALSKTLDDLKWDIEEKTVLFENLLGIKNLKSKVKKKKIKESELIDFCISIGKVLNEASVFDSKYSLGARFMLGASGKESMAKYTSVSIPDGIWLKVAEPSSKDGVIDTIHDENGRAEFWIQSESTKQIFHVKGKGTVIGKWFKKATAKAGDINFNTATLETCSLLGLYFDGLVELNSLNALKGPDDPNMPKVVSAFKDKVKSALSSGDWANHDLGKLDTAGFPQVVLVAAISAGMSKFVQDKSLSGWNFVHGKIDTYYKAEIENPNIEVAGGKDNTADCIIVNANVASFLNNMKSQKVSYESDGLCKLETGEEFYQVSLKKAAGGAQLGKITKDFTNKFGLISNEDILSMVINESLEKQILDEGLRDLFNKGKEFIKSGGQKIVDGIKNIASKVVRFAKGVFSSLKSATRSANKDGDRLIQTLVKRHRLTEAKKLSVKDACYKIAEDYNAGKKKPLKDLVQNTNTLLNTVNSLSTSTPGVGYLTSTTSLSIPSKVDFDVVVKFLANYKALSAFKTVLSSEKGNIKSASEIYDEFVDLESQMYFGRTQLPLFKVYGLDSKGSGTAYTFLKTGKEFADERKSEFDEKGDKVEKVFLVYVEAKKGYGTMGAYVFSNFKDNMAQFNYTTFRTNQAGSASFAIEGSAIKSWDWIKSNYSL